MLLYCHGGKRKVEGMRKSVPINMNWNSLVVRKGKSLPHWTCENAIYHVSFRLHDSIPKAHRLAWLAERESIIANSRAIGRELTDEENDKLRYLFSEKIDKYLDTGYGKCYLAIPKIGQMVARSLTFFDEKRYWIHAYCVMPNHTHVIVEPIFGFELEKIVHSWKSYSSTQANRLLGRNGTFWQSEPYDHIIRSLKEYRFQMEYVWNNPGTMRSGFLRWRRD